MKKILYVLGYPQRMAGSQKQIEQLIINLPEKYAPEVLLTMDSGVAKHFKSKGVITHIITPPKSLNIYGKKMFRFSVFKKMKILIFDYFGFSLSLIKFIKSHDFHIIHCNDSRAVLLMSLCSFFVKAKLITHMQGERVMSKGWEWFLFERIPLKIITNANFIKNSLSKSVLSKTQTVYPGMRIELSGNKLESTWLRYQKRHRIIISCFASIVPFKGHSHLLEAVNLLLKEKLNNHDFLVLLIGDIVKEYEFYFQWLNKLEISVEAKESIMFLGWQNAPYEYLQFSDFTVLPSVKSDKLIIKGQMVNVKGNEGFPTTHLEAMYFGKAVIGTSIAGVPEQIENNFNGLLVKPGDVIQLKEAMKRLINQRELRLRLGRNGQLRAKKKYSIKNYVHELTKIYDQV